MCIYNNVNMPLRTHIECLFFENSWSSFYHCCWFFFVCAAKVNSNYPLFFVEWCSLTFEFVICNAIFIQQISLWNSQHFQPIPKTTPNICFKMLPNCTFQLLSFRYFINFLSENLFFRFGEEDSCDFPKSNKNLWPAERAWEQNNWK